MCGRVVMSTLRRVTLDLAVAGLLVGMLVVSVADGAGTAKLQKACTILTPEKIETVVGIPIGEPDGAGSKARSTSTTRRRSPTCTGIRSTASPADSRRGTVAVSVSLTGTDDGESKDQALELVDQATNL